MRFIKCIFILIFACLLVGCAKTDTNDQVLKGKYKSAVAYANWTDDMSIINNAINNTELHFSSSMHLPIYKMESLDDLEQFIEIYDEHLTMDRGYNEVPSFLDVTSEYDESFFENNALFVVYLSTSSGSLRYGVKDVVIEDTNFYVQVEQTNSPQMGTDDMAGWFFTVAIEKDIIVGCDSYDAIFGYK